MDRGHLPTAVDHPRAGDPWSPSRAEGAPPTGGAIVLVVSGISAFVVALLATSILRLDVGAGAMDGAGSWLASAASGAAEGWWAVVSNPYYWAFLVALVVLERRFPARPEMAAVSVGMGQDLVWFLANTLLAVTVVTAYLVVLDGVYVALAGDWSLDLQRELGVWGLPVLALAVTDLMGWTSHYLHHKVPALWSFHAVHHSQEQMNVLSDSRQHVVETLITATLVFLPARILGLDSDAAAALAFLSIYVGAFIHANIRTNLGPARYLIISPQAHRVHHSAAAEHIDTNFGVILACWDYLFGTRYADDHEYPTTGIHDRSFPLERSGRPGSLVGTWWRQTTYPFARLRTHGLSFDPDRGAGDPDGRNSPGIAATGS